MHFQVYYLATAMLNLRLLPRLSRAVQSLTRASSSSSSLPAKTQPTPSTSTPVPQSPNYPTTWSTSQNIRPAGSSGPRFEQTVMELQPNPLSAMALIANEPVRLIHGRKAVCDGGD